MERMEMLVMPKVGGFLCPDSLQGRFSMKKLQSVSEPAQRVGNDLGNGISVRGQPAYALKLWYRDALFP
jgi:hypothetical protein